MSKANEQKIRDLMSQVAGLSVPEDSRPLQNLPGWDSLRHAEFIISLQREFGVHFSPAEIAGLTDLAAVIRLVQNKKGP